MKSKFLFSFILIILTLSSINLTSQLSLRSMFEIESLFTSMLFNPVQLLFQLTKIKLQSMDSDFSCTLCKNLIKAVTDTIREKYEYEGILYMAELICSIAYSESVCKSYTSQYGPFALDALLTRLGNEENLCHKFGFCDEGEDTEDVYDLAIRLLKDKPKNKKREPVDPTAPVWKMLQITDVHYDQKYIEGGSVYCDEPICCRQNASEYAREKSGKFGWVGHCDAGDELLQSFLETAADLNPDFIIWTGDNSPHNTYGGSQSENYNATIAVKEKIDSVFLHSIPVYPALGNHEIYPVDLFLRNETEILETYAEIFREYFTEEQAYENFKKYGYYTEKHGNTNLRIVVLNCLLCDSFDFYVIAGNHNAAKEEFKWLENVLRQAEKDGEFVYIIDHFPINSNFQLTECAKRLRAIVDRFDYIIRGYFSGHTHLDDISPIRAYFEPKPIININFIAPPLTTYPKRNPSFRQFLIDSNTKNVIDYQQYRLNITEANEKGEAVWHIAYNASEMYNVSDLTEIDKMCSIDVEGEYITQRYAEGEKEKKSHSKSEIKNAQCQIQSDTYHDYYVCAADSFLSVAYFYEFLNNLSGEWAKESSSSS